ncbi:hypothetical protein V6N13_128860 [Hibiscus sabdariffa]
MPNSSYYSTYLLPLPPPITTTATVTTVLRSPLHFKLSQKSSTPIPTTSPLIGSARSTSPTSLASFPISHSFTSAATASVASYHKHHRASSKGRCCLNSSLGILMPYLSTTTSSPTWYPSQFRCKHDLDVAFDDHRNCLPEKPM